MTNPVPEAIREVASDLWPDEELSDEALDRVATRERRMTVSGGPHGCNFTLFRP